jgi:hypothetical protein
MPAVVNTSPIIPLGKVQRLELQTRLYGTLLVPPAVIAELQAKPETSLQGIQSFIGSVEVRPPANTLLVRALSAGLGAGEAEATALAAEMPGSLLVMDDAAGRRVARALGIAVTGRAGILVEAKARGFVPAIAPLLDELMDEGLWLGERMRRTIMTAAGE